MDQQGPNTDSGCRLLFGLGSGMGDGIGEVEWAGLAVAAIVTLHMS